MAVPPTQAGELTVALVRLLRLMMARQRQGPRVHDKVDPATQPLLFKLTDGACRISELAELTHSETSTVSRHLSNFERHGLVAKLPDPTDGRAFRVSLTDDGRHLVARIREVNAQRMSQVLREWDEPQVAQLLGLLRRLATDLETAGPLPASQITERVTP